MRAFRLASVALEAERARLGLRVQREIRRAAFIVVALIMASAAFAMLHVIAWVAMGNVSPIWRAVIIFAFDLVIAGIFGFMATRNTPTRAEREALAIRRTAVIEARNGIGLSLIPVAFGLLRNRRRRNRM
jgi:hypothetical protein